MATKKPPHRIAITREAVELVTELGLPDDDQILYAANCGLHSGFPRCCIVFYLVASEAAFDPYVDWARVASGHGLALRFVPCPRCAIEGMNVVPLPCDCIRNFRRGQVVRPG